MHRAEKTKGSVKGSGAGTRGRNSGAVAVIPSAKAFARWTDPSDRTHPTDQTDDPVLEVFVGGRVHESTIGVHELKQISLFKMCWVPFP